MMSRKAKIKIIILSGIVMTILSPVLIYFIYHIHITRNVKLAIKKYNTFSTSNCKITYMGPGYVNFYMPLGISRHVADMSCGPKNIFLTLHVEYFLSNKEEYYNNNYGRNNRNYKRYSQNPNCYQKYPDEPGGSLICIKDNMRISINPNHPEWDTYDQIFFLHQYYLYGQVQDKKN
jgi:hypothetical protein